MLRLLPDRLYAGLFGRYAWLAHGARGHAAPLATTSNPDIALPELLEALLQAMPSQRQSRKLSIMIPNHSARYVGLPWNPDLRGSEEIHAYALAHFERAGLMADDTYAVHVEVRHYGALGLAYAVPRQLLNDLQDVAARHALKLTTVLPANGIAHLAARPARGSGVELYLIAEESAISALVVDSTGLQRYDAEPAVGGELAALRRVLVRLTAGAVNIKRITICTDSDDEELCGIASPFAVKESVHRIKSSAWRRFL